MSCGERFVDYLRRFWEWNGDYVQGRLERGRTIGKKYVDDCLSKINRIIEPYFKDTLLSDVTANTLEQFMKSIPRRDVDPENGYARRTINVIGLRIDELDMEHQVTAANSPQAKGRVERNHGIDQDRLVKEMGLKGISAIAEANKFLEETYLPKMNRKFSRPSAEKEDAHSPPGKASLKDIMCLEYEWAVGNDYVVLFEKRLYQILKSNKKLPRPRDKVTIRIGIDGSFSILWKETKLLVKELTNIQGQITSNAA